MAEDKEKGFESICNNKGCDHNDYPDCEIHTPGAPITIDETGACVNRTNVISIKMTDENS